MLGKTYQGQNCSAARALEFVGERWSLLIARDALFRGITRFGDFQRSLGVASNVLATRLETFLESGLMELRTCAGHPDHREYVLTEMGRSLQPVMIALTRWGDRWAAPHGAPVVFEHAGCGGRVDVQAHCSRCGNLSPPAPVVATSGPGARRSRRGAAHRRNPVAGKKVPR